VDLIKEIQCFITTIQCCDNVGWETERACGL